MLITTELQNNSGKARCERNELQYALRDRHKKKNSRLTNLSYIGSPRITRSPSKYLRKFQNFPMVAVHTTDGLILIAVKI